VFRTWWPRERKLKKYELLGGMKIEPYGDNWYGLYDPKEI